MNRLEQCISHHVSELPLDDIPEESAYRIQQSVKLRLMRESEQRIADWLGRVSTNYTIEFPLLQSVWQQFVEHNATMRKQKKKWSDDVDVDADMDPHKRPKLPDSVHEIPSEQSEDLSTSSSSSSASSSRIITRWVPSLRRFVHELTGMVFLSKINPVVVARWDGHVLLPLSHEDMGVCDLFRFFHDSTRFDELTHEDPFPPEEEDPEEEPEDMDEDPEEEDNDLNS